MKCRHCAADLTLPLVDLGTAPPSNAYLTQETLQRPERRFPLRVLVCERCWLVQTEDFADAHELFDADYAYFSGVSTSWLAHAERYVGEMVARFGLQAGSRVVEVAANDGYLLQYVKARGIACTGVEPTASTAAAARAKGIEIVQDFFGRRLAADMASHGLHADLMAANNVLAHVPDINDFAAGFTTLLKPRGVATFEFPHLLRLMADAQFDTILVTFTMCSVHSPAQVMAEMRRVLRPGGKVLYLEHGAAPDKGVARVQRFIEPVWKRIGGNCHLTRPITGGYEGGGFKIARSEKGYMPKTPRPFAWIEWGEARL